MSKMKEPENVPRILAVDTKPWSCGDLPAWASL